jgi:chemotaxis signal transduction protein
MATEKKRSAVSAVKTVSVHLAAEKILDRKAVLIFTASQVEEVLREITVQPLPFASDYLLGLCSWRDRVLPVIDIVRGYGLQAVSDGGGKMRYLVVRTVASGERTQDNPENKYERILRCVLKVSDQIITGNIPDDCVAVSAEFSGLDPAFADVLAKGVFEREGELMIVPDLLPFIYADFFADGGRIEDVII